MNNRAQRKRQLAPIGQELEKKLEKKVGDEKKKQRNRSPCSCLYLTGSDTSYLLVL